MIPQVIPQEKNKYWKTLDIAISNVLSCTIINQTNQINTMKNSIKDQLTAIDVQLNEWYGCMPFVALSRIHFEDVVHEAITMPKDKFEEYLDALREEWNESSIIDKIEVYEECYEMFEYFMPELDEDEESFDEVKGVLSLYSDDFERSHTWEDVCEIVGADAEYDNVSIKFIGVLQSK